MNRIYKVIWSQVKKCYVVVSEFANNRGKISGSSGTSAVLFYVHLHWREV